MSVLLARLVLALLTVVFLLRLFRSRPASSTVRPQASPQGRRFDIRGLNVRDAEFTDLKGRSGPPD